jgi:drug/metabolite transporter (DMT)-like permease
MPQRSRKLAILEGMLAGTLFGTAAILIRFLTGISVFSIAFWRLVVASVIFVVILWATRRSSSWDPIRRDIGQIALLGVLLGLHFILFVSAVLDTTIINATVLVNTTAIWSMFVSSIIFKLKPSRTALFGILVSFFGVAIITYGDASSGTWTIQLRGDLEAVLAAVVESFYLSYGKETRQRAPLMQLMMTIYVFSTITVVAIGLATAQSLAPPMQLDQILPLIGLGILPTAMAHTFYFSSLSHLKSFETAAMALLEPVGATLLGLVILQQVPKPLFALGAVLVLSGIITVAVRE